MLSRWGQQLFVLCDTEQGIKLSSFLSCALLSPLNDHFKDDWWNHGTVSGGLSYGWKHLPKSMGTSVSLAVSPDKADGVFRGCFVFLLPDESSRTPFCAAWEKTGASEEVGHRTCGSLQIMWKKTAVNQDVPEFFFNRWTENSNKWNVVVQLDTAQGRLRRPSQLKACLSNWPVGMSERIVFIADCCKRAQPTVPSATGRWCWEA